MGSTESLNALKIVFAKKRYVLISLAATVIFYLFNVFLVSASTLISFLRAYNLAEFGSFFFTLSWGFYRTLKPSGFASLIVISILFGIMIGIVAFKISISAPASKRTGVLGIFGFLFGILVPSCASCGLGVIAALGLSATVLAVLPFDGLEFSVLAIGLLVITIWKASSGLMSCSSKIGSNRKI